jgi:hypothetical protein
MGDQKPLDVRAELEVLRKRSSELIAEVELINRRINELAAECPPAVGSPGPTITDTWVDDGRPIRAPRDLPE